MTTIQNSSFGSTVKNTTTAAALGAGVGATYSYVKQAKMMNAVDSWLKSAKSIDLKNTKTLKDIIKNAPAELKNLLKNVNADSFKNVLKNIPNKLKDIAKGIDPKTGLKDTIVDLPKKGSNILYQIKLYAQKMFNGKINWQQVGKTAGKGALIGAGVIAGFSLLKSIFGGNK